MEDLFSSSLDSHFDEFAPLAARMRPRTLDEYVGQSHVVGDPSPLRSLIDADNMTSIIVWGPPGTGKTSLANVIAKATKSIYRELSAVSSSVSDVRKAIAEARDALAGSGRKTILFIDEIHRFNKSQQDALLPAVENRWIVLIGATTENPFFEVNSPLISRSLLFRLNRLSHEEVASIVRRAVLDNERGLGGSVTVEEPAIDHIISTSGGDARAALNALEVCAASAAASGTDLVTLALAQECLQRRLVRYDKGGDDHYDVVSAFIKSMRGSDPDASLFWLARMLDAGEDPRFIARRMVIFASEDVGNADPMALVLAVAAFHALEFVGLPEAQLNLSQAVTYLASCPKSNAATIAIGRAIEDLKGVSDLDVPPHLRDAHYQGAKKLGHGQQYRYPHSFPGAWVAQTYRPPEAEGHRYYVPTDRGYEVEISKRLDAIRERQAGEPESK